MKSFRPSRLNVTEPREKQANFANKNITTLPNELLVKIFSNLDTRDLLNCHLVNRRWQELIDEHMLAPAFYRRCHPTERRINPLTVERYHSSIQNWLRGFSNLGRESAAQLDKFLQHKHFTERLFFSIAKVLAKAKALTCQDVGTIKHCFHVGQPSFSPDGNFLVTFAGDTCRIWELVDGKWKQSAALVHSDRVEDVRFSPDSKHLVTITADFTVKIWGAVDDGWLEKATTQHYGELRSVCFSPDGSHLVTASTDSAVTIWGLANDDWQEKITIQHFGLLTIASFSPDGKHLVLLSDPDDDTNEIWGVVDGRWRLKATIGSLGLGFLSNTSFSPDGYHFVTASDGIAKIWVLKSQENDDSC